MSGAFNNDGRGISPLIATSWERCNKLMKRETWNVPHQAQGVTFASIYRRKKAMLTLGQAALEDTAYFEKTRAAIMDTRAWTMQQLTDRGFTVLDSRANFVFASTERISGGVLYKKLKENGILVRHFDAPRIENWLRITIGTPEQMQALMDAVDKILEV